MLTRTTNRRERGFMLIELLVSVVLIAIVVGSVATATVIHTNQSNKSKLKIDMASALEQAVEKVHVQQPWVSGNQVECASLDSSGNCTYTFSPMSTELYKINADVDIKKLNAYVYNIGVCIKPTDLNSGAQVASINSLCTTFSHDSRTADTGDLIVGSCRVNQVDERMSGGTCPTTAHSVDMDSGDGNLGPTIIAGQKVGNTWLLPPFSGYSSNPDPLTWSLAAADGRTKVKFTPNSFTAKVTKASSGTTVATVTGVGRITIPQLDRGTYHVLITEAAASINADSGYRYWPSKSSGNLIAGSTYRVTITPGTQARIIRLLEPKPQNVDMKIEIGDASIPWEPRHQKNQYGRYRASNPGNDNKNYAMLIPFPIGRAVIPGIDGTNDAASSGSTSCSGQMDDSGKCLTNWAKINDDDGTITFKNIRPGLYRTQWYQDVKKPGESWFFKPRNIGKSDNSTTRWNTTFAQNGRVGYVWVGPGGTATAYAGTPTIIQPGCSNRRPLLTKIFREVEGGRPDGSGKWIYQSPSNGKVYPPYIWDGLSNSLKADLLNNTGDNAVGWVRLVSRSGTTSSYLAAEGAWDDAYTQTYYRWRYWSTNWVNRTSTSDPGGGIYIRNVAVTAKDAKGNPTKWSYQYDNGSYGNWNPAGAGSPSGQDTNENTIDDMVEDKWRLNSYPSLGQKDDLRSQTVFDVSGKGFRTPYSSNVLFKKYGAIGQTQFSLNDDCSSVETEVAGDGNDPF